MSLFLDVQNISAGYNGNTVISDISFSVDAGERWAIIGPNGSGKSTLLNTIAGHIPIHSGHIRLGSTPYTTLNAQNRAQLIAHVPQPTGRQFPPFSVTRFVALARHPWRGLFDSPSTHDDEAVAQALAITDTSALASRRLTELSGGELQRVLLAGAVAQDTPLILLDEPESFMDPRHTLMIRQALARIHDEKGCTIITVLHDVDAAVSNHSHILALKNGEQMFAGPTGSLELPVLEALYDVPFEFAKGGKSGRSVLIVEARP